jgi:hypothetical protein
MDEANESTLATMPPPSDSLPVLATFTVASIAEQFTSFSSMLTKGSLPAPWGTFLGAKAATPYAVAPLDLLATRLARNASTFGINYLLIGLAASVFRICVSPSLLFLSGGIVMLCAAYQSRSFERMGVSQLHAFRATAAATFIVVRAPPPPLISNNNRRHE